MGRHTIGDKRGSVRGAPPDVYLGFTSFEKKSEEAEVFGPVLDFFGCLCKGALLYLAIILFAIVWYAFGEPDA
jgi:hypothetical protein